MSLTTPMTKEQAQAFVDLYPASPWSECNDCNAMMAAMMAIASGAHVVVPSDQPPVGWRVFVNGDAELFSTRSDAERARTDYESDKTEADCQHEEPEPLYAYPIARTWRPIATAPKDGTRILICRNDLVEPVTLAYWSMAACGFVTPAVVMHAALLGWAPLLEPPAIDDLRALSRQLPLVVERKDPDR